MSRSPLGWNRQVRARRRHWTWIPRGGPPARPCWAARAACEAGRLDPVLKLVTTELTINRLRYGAISCWHG
jgi:hypothetical protein